MKIERATTIKDVPGFEKIEVRPNATGELGPVIALTLSSDFTFDSDNWCVFPQSFDLDAIREVRDALNAAIEEAEALEIVLRAGQDVVPGTPVRLFMPGQIVELEDIAKLPDGTELSDKEDDPSWRVENDGKLTFQHVEWSDHSDTFKTYGPFTIVSLPGGES